MFIAQLAVSVTVPCQEGELLVAQYTTNLILNDSIEDVNANFHGIGRLSAENASVHNCWGCGDVAVKECHNCSSLHMRSPVVDSVFSGYLSAINVSESVSWHAESLENVDNSIIINITGNSSAGDIKNSVVNCFECEFTRITQILNSILTIISDKEFSGGIDSVAASSIDFKGKTRFSGQINLVDRSILRLYVNSLPEQSAAQAAIQSVAEITGSSMHITLRFLDFAFGAYAVETCGKISSSNISLSIIVLLNVSAAQNPVGVFRDVLSVANVKAVLNLDILPAHRGSLVSVHFLYTKPPETEQNVVGSLSIRSNTPIASVAVEKGFCWEYVAVDAIVLGGIPARVENNTCTLVDTERPVQPQPSVPQLAVTSSRFHQYGHVFENSFECDGQLNTNDFSCILNISSNFDVLLEKRLFILFLSIFALFLVLAVALLICGVILLIKSKHNAKEIKIGNISKAQIELTFESKTELTPGVAIQLTPEELPQQLPESTRFTKFSLSSSESSEDDIELMRQEMRGQAGCVEMQIGKERERKIMTGAKEKLVKVV